jgi:hypothetical protein
VVFSLEEVCNTAGMLLETRPDPVPAYRLLKEVLRLPSGDPELMKARQAAEQSRWIRQLVAAQLPDGSWGRFHSQDTKVKTAFRTSEEAIDRAFSLGLGADHVVLRRAQAYIEKVLTGQAHITDWEEKSEAWPLLIHFILAGRLAALQGRWPQIEPAHPLWEDGWDCLAKVARRAFGSGQYRLGDEVKGFLDLTGLHVPKGFLESQYALWILSTRPLPGKLDQDLVEWIWNKPDGIRYVRVPLAEPQHRTIAYWFRSINILTRFACWQQVSTSTLNRLWEQRNVHGLWDFGGQIARCTDFPLSENWRQSIKRKVDYSTSMLVVLRRWFD